MKIEKYLFQKKKAILKKWFQLILNTYPEEAAQFMNREKDPFDNPVGSTIGKGIEDLFEALQRKIDPKTVSSSLDRIIRIRAIQDFSPSQAINFIFILKDVLREELKSELQDANILKEVFELESRIDELALIAFDIFMKCREKIYELKANEIKNRYFRLLQRANLLTEVPEQEP